MKKFWENFTDIMINEGLPAFLFALLFGAAFFGLYSMITFFLEEILQ